MRTPISLLTVAAVVVLAAGCGGSKKTTSSAAVTGSSTTVSGNTINIVEKEFTLTPAAITVTKAGTYTINGENQGKISHGIAIKGQGLSQVGATVDPGGTSTITVDISKPGAYEVYCPVGNHEQLGMKAALVLTGGTASSAGSGGTSTSDSSGGYG